MMRCSNHNRVDILVLNYFFISTSTFRSLGLKFLPNETAHPFRLRVIHITQPGDFHVIMAVHKSLHMQTHNPATANNPKD